MDQLRSEIMNKAKTPLWANFDRNDVRCNFTFYTWGEKVVSQLNICLLHLSVLLDEFVEVHLSGSFGF